MTSPEASDQKAHHESDADQKASSRKRHRGNGEGSIYQRADGKWVAAISIPQPGAAPKRKVVYGKTRKEVSGKLTMLLAEQERGQPIVTERRTVAEFLAGWLEESVKPSVRPRTYDSYAQQVRLHLAPQLGKIMLTKLTPADVQSLMNRLLASGLSPRSVDYCRAILRRALNQALRWGLVARNVATLVDPPKQQPVTPQYLTPAEARHFLDTALGHRLEALFMLTLAAGLRQGEVLGLRWSDVDLERGSLTVSHQLQRLAGKLILTEPKSKRSHRTITVPEFALDGLREHRQRQLVERLAAPVWHDLGLVFCSSIGTPIDPRNLARQHDRLRNAAGFPKLRFHDLRHSCASLLMAQGVNPRVVMEILGHSQVSLTLDIYSHVVPELQADSAARLDALLGGR